MRTVSYQGIGRIGIIKLVRPKSLNALTTEVLEELQEAFQQVDLGKIRCLVLTGSGDRAFAVGADIAEICEFSKAKGRQFSKKGNDVFLMIERFPIPVIAAVQGYALGGGCELALSCDIRLCSEDARFGLPEVGLGISPGFGGTQRLGRIIGPGRAKELIYTAEKIDAAEAYRIGLVNHIYDKAELFERAVGLAEEIAAKAPIAVRAAKEAVNRGAHMDMCAAVHEESELFGECFESEDQRRGMAGFLNKKRNITFENE